MTPWLLAYAAGLFATAATTWLLWDDSVATEWTAGDVTILVVALLGWPVALPIGMIAKRWA